MGKIHQLDAQTANMIAAGEVVERPAGVVKELVENAIDAGSTRIAITAEQGGIDRLTVSDNGCGMSSEDAVNAFLRHATSKIHGQNDLWDIHTLGFRGEALPSIASVSKLTMNTSDGNESTQVRIEYGKTVSVASYPCNQGTEITVEGLFYRTPARLKHLRSGSYENSLIQDLIMRFAMSHPEIAFSYVSNGREAFRTTGSDDLLEVLFLCWGREPAAQALEIKAKDYDYTLSGYLVKPNITRASRNFMQVFLNHRMVHTYRLYRAIQDGYADFIVKDRMPMAVINIDMDPHLLDVNVHPSKWEVRLSKEIQLEYLIRDSVHETLTASDLAKHADIAKEKEPQTSWFSRIQLDIDTPPAPVKQEPETVEEKEPEPVIKEVPAVKEEARTVPEETVVPAKAAPVQQKEIKEEIEEEEKETLPSLQVIGQLHERYVLCASPHGLAVLDQRRCMNRVSYERILSTMNGKAVMQDLLVPVTIHADAAMVSRLEELNEACNGLQISFEAFGPDTLLVRSVPSWLKDVEEKQFLEDLLEMFVQEKDMKYMPVEKKRAALLACRRSVHVHQKLSMQEMQALVEQLCSCQNPSHDPNGKPTVLLIDEKDLEKELS